MMSNYSIIRKSNGMLPKSVRTEVFEFIVSSVLKYHSTSTIAHNVEKKFKIELSYRMIQKYVKKAKEWIENRPILTNPDQLIKKHIALREDMLRDCTKIKDRLAVAESIARLQGLEKREVEVTHKHLKDDVPTEKLIEIVQKEADSTSNVKNVKYTTPGSEDKSVSP